MALLGILIIFALVLTAMEFKFHFLLLALAAAATWMGIAFLLLVDSSVIGLDVLTGTSPTIFGFIFIILTFIPILHFWMMMGKQQMTTTDGDGRTVKMWSKPTPILIESRSDKVKREHREKIRAIGIRHRHEVVRK